MEHSQQTSKNISHHLAIRFLYNKCLTHACQALYSTKSPGAHKGD